MQIAVRILTLSLIFTHIPTNAGIQFPDGEYAGSGKMQSNGMIDGMEYGGKYTKNQYKASFELVAMGKRLVFNYETIDTGEGFFDIYVEMFFPSTPDRMLGRGHGFCSESNCLFNYEIPMAPEAMPAVKEIRITENIILNDNNVLNRTWTMDWVPQDPNDRGFSVAYAEKLWFEGHFSNIEDVANSYLQALTDLSYDSYLSTILPNARSFPPLGSNEAMHFWHDRLVDIYQQGFNGDFAIEMLEARNEGNLPEAMVNFIDTNGEFMGVGIFLMYDNSSWWAIRIEDHGMPQYLKNAPPFISSNFGYYWEHPFICQDTGPLLYKECLLASDVVMSFHSVQECELAAEFLKLEKTCTER